MNHAKATSGIAEDLALASPESILNNAKAIEASLAPLMKITPADTLSLFLNNLPPGSKVTIEIGGKSQ